MRNIAPQITDHLAGVVLELGPRPHLRVGDAGGAHIGHGRDPGRPQRVFDTELKPTFLPGEASQGPHVVQFALLTKAFLFQLHRPYCRSRLVSVLLAKRVRTVSFGLESDHGQIHAKPGVARNSVLDWTAFFRNHGYGRSIGVRAAVGVVLLQRFASPRRRRPPTEPRRI